MSQMRKLRRLYWEWKYRLKTRRYGKTKSLDSNRLMIIGEEMSIVPRQTWSKDCPICNEWVRDADDRWVRVSGKCEHRP